MTGPREPKQGGSGWMVALFALPVPCCAAPVVLAAIGAGSVGALLGEATGSVALGPAGLVVGCVAVAVVVAVLAGRRTRR